MKGLFPWMLAMCGLSMNMMAEAESAPSVACYDVVPMPKEVRMSPSDEGFIFDSNTMIVGEGSQIGNSRLFAEYMEHLTGHRPVISSSAPARNYIRLATGNVSDSPDGYRISIGKDSIVVYGQTEAGTFYGLQTLRKATAPSLKVYYPAAEIQDEPRFAYRGAHFDVSRHFFPADSVKKLIDIMALHNMNRLHWHLTDDQGWRIEVPAFPRLVEIGSVRKHTMVGDQWDVYDNISHGGHFKDDEIRDIVDYAVERHIEIMPEIDLPGHMQAALAAYPELGCTGGPYEVWGKWGVSDEVLCAGNDKTYEFMDSVLDKLMDLFPSRLIHIGGDECPKTRWEKCGKCQAKIRQLGLYTDSIATAEQRLQSHVMKHAAARLASRGRVAVGWDEILEGGADRNTVIMSWRGTEGGRRAAEEGHDVIMTPAGYLYFDFRQGESPDEPGATYTGPLPLKKTYFYEPLEGEIPKEDQKHILGVQANLWTEKITNFQDAQYMVLPRYCALAEIQWSSHGKDWEGLKKRMRHMKTIYDAEGYRSREASYTEP